MKEIWKNIRGYSGVYQVSNLGRVRRNKKLKYGIPIRILKPIADHTNHCKVSLYKNKKMYIRYIHRLVMQEFIGPPTKRQYSVNHIDCNPKNNKLVNLEYCSHQENTNHAIKNNLIKMKGKNHPRTHLKDKDIIEIRKYYKNKIMNQKKLAKKYSVCQSTINHIISRLNWSHIK